MSDHEAACFATIDIGSRQVRSSVIDSAGKQLSSDRRDIGVESPEAGWFVQDSAEIWAAVLAAVQSAVAASGRAADIRGVAVDATCSMVIVHGDGSSASSKGDVLMWMDQRAVAEAATLSGSGAACLTFLGGTASPEHQMPKLGWLFNNWSYRMRAASAVFDLSDWVVWKLATASDAASGATATPSGGSDTSHAMAPQDAPRSACTTTCKWGYMGHVAPTGSHDPAGAASHVSTGAWCKEGYATLKLDALLPSSFSPTPRPAIGCHLPVLAVGSAFPRGVSEGVAAKTGLGAGVSIAAALIDAHAGALAMTKTSEPAPAATAEASASSEPGAAGHRMAVVAGTSACHMVLIAGEASSPPLVPGVWGPYYEAVAPGTWLLEAGQSAAGAALDRIVRGHPAYAGTLASLPAVTETAATGSVPHALYAHLDTILDSLASDSGTAVALLAEPYLVCPDIAGNRSPLADATVRGAIVGVSTSDDDKDLAKLYLATLQGLALGTRLIMDHLDAHGVHISELVLSGGLGQSERFATTLAEACGVRVLRTADGADSMSLGCAMAAAAASGVFPSLAAAQEAMAAEAASVCLPCKDADVAAFYSHKLAGLKALYALQTASA